MTIRIRVEGAREVGQALRRVADELAPAVGRALRTRVAEPMADRARAAVRVRTGRWQRSVTSGAVEGGGWMEWTGGLVYPPILEFAPKWGGAPAGRYIGPLISRADAEAFPVADVAVEGVIRAHRLN
jgi:hypothetical protein